MLQPLQEVDLRRVVDSAHTLQRPPLPTWSSRRLPRSARTWQCLRANMIVGRALLLGDGYVRVTDVNRTQMMLCAVC